MGPTDREKSEGIMHEIVDIDRWKQMFPLSPLREQAREFVMHRSRTEYGAYVSQAAIERDIARMEPGGTQVTSPRDIAIIEQLREEALAGRPKPGGLATDVFVFGLGEPDRREVTKVGGLPYWPVGQAWPRTRILHRLGPHGSGRLLRRGPGHTACVVCSAAQAPTRHRHSA